MAFWKSQSRSRFQNSGLIKPHDTEQDKDEEDFTDWEEDDEEGELASK